MATSQISGPAVGDIFNAYAARMVRVKAIGLCVRPEFAGEDREDIEQELTLFLLRQAHYYDPQKSQLNTFINRVIRSRISTLIRDRSRNRRMPAKCNGLQSTEALIDCGDGTITIRETLTQADRDRRLGLCGKEHVDEVQLTIDVQEAIASLPANLRPVARSLMTRNFGETKEKMKLSHRVFARQRQQIADHFKARGLALEIHRGKENERLD